MKAKSKTTNRFRRLLFTTIIIVLTYPFVLLTFRETGRLLGLVKLPVPVVGTGSMYPSLFWEISEGGPEDPATKNLYDYRTQPPMYRFNPPFPFINRFLPSRSLKHGDIIAFRNATTQQILSQENKNPQAGFVKRIIGLPGDKIEIRDGFVWRNGERIQEPYIYKPRSTYGGEFLPDCQTLTVPEGKLFVLGDNRKISSDSRGKLGLISFQDVNFILPYTEQNIFRDFWRDSSHDDQLAHQPTLSTSDFYSQLNHLRQKANLPRLRPNTLLETSARLRAQKILATNDFSVEATRSGLTMSKAMTLANYHNPLKGEFIIQGYYDTQELLQSLTYNTSLKTQIMDSRYQDIGLAVVNGSVSNCPTQVIVGHLGGYVPAEYDSETIQSWKSLRENLDQIIPSWEEAKNYPQVDQEKLTQLLNLLYRRRQLADEIYTTMINQRWLTQEQRNRIKEDENIAQQAKQLIDQLNGDSQ